MITIELDNIFKKNIDFFTEYEKIKLYYQALFVYIQAIQQPNPYNPG